MFRSLLTLVCLMPVFANAGSADSIVEYTRDEHFIYAKLPVGLTFDDEQMDALRKGRDRIVAQLQKDFAINPRVGKADVPIADAVNSSTVFETSLDSIVTFMQRNYATITSAGWHRWHALPTGFVVYGGVAASGVRFLPMGGSITAGAILMFKKVSRTSVDTGQTDEYVEASANGFVWPSAYFSITKPGLKVAAPVGGGLVWGTLAKAEDFGGVALSYPFTLGTGVLRRLKWKVSFIKNINKSTWPSNTMITFSVVLNDPDTVIDPDVGISVIADLQTYLHGGMDLLQSAGQKWFGMKPPAPSVERLPGDGR